VNRLARALTGTSQPRVVTYATAGDPDLVRSRDVVRAMARGGADVIEIGVPFSDPIADGPAIQRSSERALAAGTTLRSTLDLVGQRCQRLQLGGLERIKAVHRDQRHIGQQARLLAQRLDRQVVEALPIGPRDARQSSVKVGEDPRHLGQPRPAIRRARQGRHGLRSDPGALHFSDRLPDHLEETRRSKDRSIEGKPSVGFELPHPQPEQSLAGGLRRNRYRASGTGQDLLEQVTKRTHAHAERSAHRGDAATEGRNLGAVGQDCPARPDRSGFADQQLDQTLGLAAGGGGEQDGGRQT